MTVTRRQTINSISNRQSPRRFKNRYSLMPNRMNNDYLHGGVPGGMKRDKNIRQSINIYKPPNSNLALNDYQR